MPQPPGRFAALLIALAASCASGEAGEEQERLVDFVQIEFDQNTVVHSSVLTFRFLDTARREARLAEIHFSGSLGEGRAIDEVLSVPVDRIGDDGDLVAHLRVSDGLWELVNPDPDRTLTGQVELALVDEIGVFARGDVKSTALRFRSEFPPEVVPLQSGRAIYPNSRISVSGENFLRPEEGTSWAIVDTGRVRFPDGATRQVTNARVALEWEGDRRRAALPVSPAIFGVMVGEFEGGLRFENELKTGEKFPGNSQPSYTATIRAPEINEISPEAGSRGQKVSIIGHGFVEPDTRLRTGTYLVVEGELQPRDPAVPPISLRGDSTIVKIPYAVQDGETIIQDVWYSVDPATRALTGLGAFPGTFTGTMTPVVFQGEDEQIGSTWSGTFTVLPTRQEVHVKFLPGFSRALRQYGLGAVESDVRDRIFAVLERDYSGVNAGFDDEEPTDFIEFTTIEIGGPDPSGLLNFGYDNSFNDGGKDLDNLYLSDYLGGVNRHSQDAGYLPFGGVFIESFIAFSPRLFPEGFGTSEEFDRVLSPFMPALGGTPVSEDEWPDGPRAAAVANAIDMMGNLTGHTASHEIGHALGLAYFPASVEGFDERFHNDPPGRNQIMDAGADRPFEERAELNGAGPSKFSPDNLRYLQSILPAP